MSETRIGEFARLVVGVAFLATSARPFAASGAPPGPVAMTLAGFMRQEVGLSNNNGERAGAVSVLSQQSDNEVDLNFRTTLDNGVVIDGRWEREGTGARLKALIAWGKG